MTIMKPFFNPHAIKETQAERDAKTIFLNEHYKGEKARPITIQDFNTFFELYPQGYVGDKNEDEAFIEWKELCNKKIRPTLIVIEKALTQHRKKEAFAIFRASYWIKDETWIFNLRNIIDIANQTSYPELLKHPLWQRKRLEIMQRDDFTCQSCGETESILNVHHKKYRANRKPWEYKDDNFITLCEDCHENMEILKKINKHE